tara:strand:+ start:12 stop:401 length:390 start_codon:yes stop_codon:yes gene_type:complete
MFEKTIKKYLFNELQFFDESQDEERNALNYFRRSRIHWIYLLNLMSSYYEKKPITKSDLIHKIQISHITILKYIKETIQLNFVEEVKSKRDRRKVILIPQNILIQDFEDFYYEHTREMKQLFDERQEDS